MSEDDMPIGDCVVCGDDLDLNDSGFCSHCKQSFCWNKCGDWVHANHCCIECKELLETKNDK